MMNFEEYKNNIIKVDDALKILATDLKYFREDLLQVEQDDGSVKHYEKVDGKWNLYAIEDSEGEVFELTDIPNFSRYKAYLERGMIYSLVSNKWLNANTPNRFGYLFSSYINDNGTRTPASVHSMIMSAFMGVQPEFWLSKGLEIDHVDGNKTNNKCGGIGGNLRLVTRKEQFTDEVRAKMGKGIPLTEEQVNHIKFTSEILKAKGELAINKVSHYFADKYEKGYVTVFNVLKNHTHKNVQLTSEQKSQVRQLELQHDLARLGIAV